MAQLLALLLTDVVDSTRLTEELGDVRMAELWTAHDRIARDLLPLWRGREIDKTDGMLLLFDAVGDAVGYALAYHRALAVAKLPLQARAGIHVGPVTLRPNPANDIARGAKPIEVDGLALPITARVMSVALGAQTLLSADARLALAVVPQRVLSHGYWRMHGVADPIELFEVGEAGAPFAAPPDGAKVYRVMRQGDLWQPVREVKHSVPAERDSFVGRQEPLRLIAKKLEDGARLISVLGIGGTGKTRLVTRFAWTHLGDYPGGVWFCDLSQARTVDGIFFAAAQGLDVPLGKTDPVVQLAHAIAGRGECLVILDNFEQVARHAEETLGRWLDRAPLARFMATSREVLGIVGEEAMLLDPLPIEDAVTLFEQRGAAALEGFGITSDERSATQQLAQVLEGLPLAIELAAARVRVMRPRALLAGMHRRFDLLQSKANRQYRQSTLRATFDWSWDLLDTVEKAVLAQLAVFEGGFTLESADAIVSLPPRVPEATSPRIVIWQLVDKSLIRRSSDERFELLESLREYSIERLGLAESFLNDGIGLEEATHKRHWSYFSNLDERAAASDRCAEANNLVAACNHATAAGDTRAATGALLGAWAALRLSGPLRVAAELADLVARRAALRPEERAMVNWVAGSALNMLGDTEAGRRALHAGMSLAISSDSKRATVRLLIAQGEQHLADGELDRAMSSFERSLEIGRQLGDPVQECAALNAMGRLLEYQSRPLQARQCYEAALEIARRLRDHRFEGGLLGNLGGLRHELGEFEDAQRLYQQAVAIGRDVGDRRWAGNAHCNLGLLLHEMGRHEQALPHFEEALATARAIGFARLECTTLCNLGIAFDALGKPKQAQENCDLAVRAARRLGDRRAEGQCQGYLAIAHARAGDIATARLCIESGEHLLRSAGDQSSLALLLCQRSEIEGMAGKTSLQRSALKQAAAIAAQLNSAPTSELARKLALLQPLRKDDRKGSRTLLVQGPSLTMRGSTVSHSVLGPPIVSRRKTTGK
jgi:predicted ATPase/class 3 adenylate cyclase/Tfp pilus assembly protein PilF